MGLLIDGKWHDSWYDTKDSGGAFKRQEANFRNWITADGSAGPSGDGGFKAEAGRYHLYVSHACPWAHRALIFRTLKGLDDLSTYRSCIPTCWATAGRFKQISTGQQATHCSACPLRATSTPVPCQISQGA